MIRKGIELLAVRASWFMVFGFASVAFCFVFVFMLSLEHWRCCFNILMSSTPRTALVIAHVTRYMVNTRSVGVKNTRRVEFQ